MKAKYTNGTYEVTFSEADTAWFSQSTDAPPGTVHGSGSYVFDAQTGDLLGATGAAQGRGELEWMAFSQDVQDEGIRRLGYEGIRVNPFDFEGHMPELRRPQNPRKKTDRISRTRGVKTMRGPYSEGRGYEPWIQRQGTLGEGFLTTMTKPQRHRALDECVASYGYRSCLGKIMALERAKTGPYGEGEGVGAKYAAQLEESRDYLRETYGGEGSFGPSGRRKTKREAQQKMERRAAERGPGYRNHRGNPSNLDFDEAVIALAKEDGAEFVVTQIPGVWEEVSEYYNNEAIDRGGDFDEAVVALAKEDGAEFIVTRIPGVWEEASEYYNNEALARMANPDPRLPKPGRHPMKRKGKRKGQHDDNPYMGDAVALADYRRRQDQWVRGGRRGPPPVPPKRRELEAR